MTVLQQRPASCCYWLTGLSGAGKTTTAVHALNALAELGYMAIHLDGDELRQGLNNDLGFTRADRQENIRRIAEITKLLVDAGIVVLVSVISPYRADREAARARIGEQRCFEVFVNTSLDVCRQRDAKGLYARAASGTLAEFTGVQAPYESPRCPAITICTENRAIGSGAADIIQHYLNFVSRTHGH